MFVWTLLHPLYDTYQIKCEGNSIVTVTVPAAGFVNTFPDT